MGVYDAIIEAAASKYSVPPNLIAAQIQHESNGDPNAVGDGGLARGLGQMHADACETVGFDWNDMFNPTTAIMGMAAYLRWCRDRTPDWMWALAAYNRGPGVTLAGLRYAEIVIQIKTGMDASPSA